MAPRENSRSRREADYSNIGVAGRKTGVTLKDTGERDEHGLEPIDGIFSSPEKPPPKANGVNHHDITIVEEESMDTGESTIPEPTAILAARRKLPPPKARSPMKTALHSSPRRSIGPPSSPARHLSATPSRSLSRSAVNRKLDFSVDELRQSIERSPKPSKPKVSVMNGPELAPSRPKAGKVLSVTAKGKRRIFDLSMDANDDNDDDDDDDLGDIVEEDSALLDEDRSEADAELFVQDDSLQIAETEPADVEPADIEDEQTLQIGNAAEKSKSKRGRPRRSLQNQSVPPTEAETASAPAIEPKKRGRRAKPVPTEALTEAPIETAMDEIEARGAIAEDIAVEQALAARKAARKAAREQQALAATLAVEEEEEPPDEVSDEAEVIEAKPKPNPRKRKNAQREPEPEPELEAQSELEPEPEPEAEPQVTDIFDINSQVDLPEPTPLKPVKRAKTTKASKAAATLEDEPPVSPPSAQQRTGKKAKKAPRERDPNARITSRKGPKTQASATRATSVTNSATLTRLTGRSLQVLRHETPAQDVGSRLMRSGRTSVKPLAFWRGERAIFGDMSLQGKQVVLPGIKEIVRADEILPEPRSRRKGSIKKKAKKKIPREEESSSEEEYEDEIEAWEVDDGILTHETIRWDPRLRRGDPEEVDETEIAFSPLYIAAASRDVQGAQFKYAKTLTLPFFGSGIVDLPPSGQKRIKNARRMQMVFFVFSGRVRVTVNELNFGVSKGGMWIVPRGNLYGIQNVSDTRPARIFFAQGCEMSEEEMLREEGATGAE